MLAVSDKEKLEDYDLITTLYLKYRKTVFKEAYCVLNDYQMAEDITNDTFLYLYTIREKLRLENKKELIKFMKIVAHNRAVDYCRKNSKCVSLEVICDNTLMQIDNIHSQDEFEKIYCEDLIKEIRKLNTIYRDPLTLKIAGYKVKEIALMLGIEESTVKVRLYRARVLLKSSLSKWTEKK